MLPGAMITERVPQKWQELQTCVAEILEQCGFAVKVEKKITHVRGKIAIDVYAEEINRGRKNVILCECKRWNSSVPQTVVHSFRTAMLDIGANTGYIISLKGFQSGAREAVGNTNIKLLSWKAFQTEFQGTWLENYLIPTVTEQLDAFMTYTEPFPPDWVRRLSIEDQISFKLLREKNFGLGYLVNCFSKHGLLTAGGAYPTLPLRHSSIQIGGLTEQILDISGYGDLAAIMLERGKAATEEFRNYREKATGKRDGPNE